MLSSCHRLMSRKVRMLEGAQMKVMLPTPWRGPGGQGCALRGIPGSGHRPSYSSSSSSYAISAEEARAAKLRSAFLVGILNYGISES